MEFTPPILAEFTRTQLANRSWTRSVSNHLMTRSPSVPPRLGHAKACLRPSSTTLVCFRVRWCCTGRYSRRLGQLVGWGGHQISW